MIFDFSISFKKIKSNQYIYRPSPILSSKGYLLTLKERNAVKNLSFIFMGNVIKMTSICIPVMTIVTKLGIPLYVGFLIYLVAFIFVYGLYRRPYKKIIGSRVKVQCSREPFIDFQKNIAKGMSWLNLGKASCSIIITSLGAAFVFFHLSSESSGTLIILFYLLLAMVILGISVVCLWVYLKLKMIISEKKMGLNDL